MTFRLLGPVCYYDMVRTARRGRFYLLRCLYALGLVSLLLLMYGNEFNYAETSVRPQQLTRFGENFFYVFMIIQFFLAQLLTPAYVAGAIAEEKERKTLEFLLATDLQGQEIVFSKLISRLGSLLLFLLAGLPILSLLQLFGGISPELLWCGFAATGISVLSTACLSILISVHVRKSRDAIVRTLMLVLAYYLFCFLFLWLYVAVTNEAAWKGTMTAGTMNLDQQVLAWTFEAVTSGQFVLALVRIFGTDLSGLGLSRAPRDVLMQFALFHGVVAAGCLLWACWRVRPVFIRQNYGLTRRAKGTGGSWFRRPAVGERPILWKERYVEAATRLTKGAVFFYVLCLLLTLAPLGFISYYVIAEGGTYEVTSSYLNMYARVAGTVVALLLLLGVGVRAASSVAAERDKQTLDSLMVAPLTLSEILGGKWLGSLLGAKFMCGLLLFIWGLGLLTGGLHVIALPLSLAAVVIYSMFMASLGLAFSVTSATANRAIFWTVGVSLLVLGCHWICCGPLLAFSAPHENMLMFFLALTPPAALGWLAFSATEMENVMGRDSGTLMTVFTVVGLALYAFAAAMLWFLAQNRFDLEGGRVNRGFTPARIPPPQRP